MRLWCDVYDAAGGRLGAGPVLLTTAAVTRVLDGVGAIRLSAPGTDGRARALLVNENRVRIWWQANDGADIRELGRGVIRRVRASGSPEDWSLTVEGADDLDTLTRISTRLGRKYSGQSVAAIAADLVGLVSGWSASASGGSPTDARFDGQSVFNALLGLAEGQGLHVRARPGANTVEVGAFGSDAGLRLVNPVGAYPDLDDHDEIGLIERIEVESDSEAVCTRLYPLGAGIGEAYLTLAKATRASPYAIQTATLNGIVHYFLEDASASADYGVIEKVGKFSQIAPLSNSEADQEAAANALYDVAAAWLQRYSQRLDAYRLTVRKARLTVRPGDRVRLVYNGVVMRDGAVVHYLDVDADFWVMEATERVGIEGAALDLVLASVDRHAQDSARLVIGALEDLKLDGVAVKPYLNLRSYVFPRVIDPTHPAVVPVRMSNATQRLNRCVVKIKTRSYVSTVAPGIENTLHQHTTFAYVDGVTPAYAGPFYWRQFLLYDSTGSPIQFLLPVSEETADIIAYSGTETNEDYLTLAYGLQEDSLTPDTLRLFVNGTDYTASLGGPWAVGGGNAEVTLDITQAILTEAGGDLQQEFEVRLTCDADQGEVEWIVEIYEVIQSIAVA